MSICIIPCGFRCYTSNWLKKQGITNQATLPFDNGFFPSESIAKFISDGNIKLNQSNSIPMVKHGEKTPHLKFTSSTYALIDSAIAKTKKYDNTLLDTTRGYYTWYKKYNFILAHYNWHASSNQGDGSKGIDHNMAVLTSILNRRRQRLIDQINKATEVRLVYWSSNHETICINDTQYDLSSNHVKDVLSNAFSKLHRNVIFQEIGKDLK